MLIKRLVKNTCRLLVASLLVLIVLTPKIAHALYVSSYLEHYGIISTAELDHDAASSGTRTTPAAILACSFAWRLQRTGFWGLRSSTTSMFVAAVSLAATVNLSAQIDAFMFHTISMHTFRDKHDCRLIEDSYGSFFVPRFLATNVPSSVKNTAAALLGLECTSAGVEDFRFKTSLLAEEYVLHGVAMEWIGFLQLVLCTGGLTWLIQSTVRRMGYT